jgi:predicted RecB family nuclease
MPLTKTDFMSGAQCHKLLWWRRHEPDAVELQPNKVLEDLFDQGNLVGALARERFPGGVLIPYARSRAERARLTADAVAAGAMVIFEASFQVDEIFVACDVIVRDATGWRLFEVKSSSKQKPEHIPDLAIQAYVLEQSGLTLTRIAVMHLNADFRHPGTGDLFASTDVTDAVRERMVTVAEEAERQLRMLKGPVPDVPIGANCADPWDCVFRERCWPQEDGHIGMLYNVGAKRAAQYMAKGVHFIDHIPKDAKLPFAAQRQRRSLAGEPLIVEPTLADALEPFDVEPLGFLDFETISRAVPVWDAMGPWGMAAAQFSYHEALPNGAHRHVEHLAEGPQDARPLVAERLIEATRHAKKIVTYSSFEKTRIRDLAAQVPALAHDLKALEAKLVDLLPVVREHVYHRAFRGSFSLKGVLPALVPDMTYHDLVIVDGRVASVEIARLLFVADRIPLEERDRVRRDLLEYCKRDTWAMVRLLQELRLLAGRGRPTGPA